MRRNSRFELTSRISWSTGTLGRWSQRPTAPIKSGNPQRGAKPSKPAAGPASDDKRADAVAASSHLRNGTERFVEELGSALAGRLRHFPDPCPVVEKAGALHEELHSGRTWPPSMISVWPVTKRASGDTRYRTAQPTSSGSPGTPSGMPAISLS